MSIGLCFKGHPAVMYLNIVSSVNYTRLSKKSCTECPPLIQQVCNWVNILIKKQHENINNNIILRT